MSQPCFEVSLKFLKMKMLEWNILIIEDKGFSKKSKSFCTMDTDSMLGTMLAMGFPKNRAQRALSATSSIENAISWLDEHRDDPDIDEPMAADEASAPGEEGSPMTKEQIDASISKLRAQALEKRKEREEQARAQEFQREKERREAAQKAKRTLDEQRTLKEKLEMEKAAEQKRQDKLYLERLRRQIKEDREERLIRSGKVPVSQSSDASAIRETAAARRVGESKNNTEKYE
ncbi:UBX domain-containing protein 1-like [Schistocerca gregaria]|uniref:UBX domain-containing protein 1-like n=1 Tax=Schistocerca gregaria TaxID=7010 RepID=UPI00211E20AC|nr:UBX domain-containing protein 1-like [Schistocerca gregaria]